MFSIFRRRKKEDREYYRLLKEIFGLKPNNVELYKLALIHRSASQFLSNGVPINNERLEFLGDAVIESVVSDYLFIEFPHENEGFLTQMRSRLVNRATLNELCKDIGLDKHICCNARGGGEQRNLNGDAFEAMIGAIYLDKGYDVANRTLISLLQKHITLDEVRTTETDFKSRLIEWCQKGRHQLRFSTGFSNGGSQSAPQFRSVAIIDGMEVGFGLGSSKKEAEQRAAYAVSQALSDDMGDMILEMIDTLDGVGGVPVAENKPKRRRKRGGAKHRKALRDDRVSDAKLDEVVETVVAEGVVSVSVESVGGDDAVSDMGDTTAIKETASGKRRRGRPRKDVVAEVSDKAGKPEAGSKKVKSVELAGEGVAVEVAPRRRGRPRKDKDVVATPDQAAKQDVVKTKESGIEEGKNIELAGDGVASKSVKNRRGRPQKRVAAEAGAVSGKAVKAKPRVKKEVKLDDQETVKTKSEGEGVASKPASHRRGRPRKRVAEGVADAKSVVPADASGGQGVAFSKPEGVALGSSVPGSFEGSSVEPKSEN